MRVTVFGASGKVGRLVVAESLRRGLTVTACVHSHTTVLQRLAKEFGGQLIIQQCDIYQSSEVARALQGSEAVVSALGSWGSKRKDVVASAMRTILPAMQVQGITRIVTVTGTEAFTPDERPPLWRAASHGLARLAANRILHDGEQHIRQLQQSSADWTVLRSPVMTDSADNFYRLTTTPGTPWQTIPRKAVAKAVVDQIEGPAYSRAAPFVYRQASRF